MDNEGAGMPQMEQPQENHKWLQQIVGDWEFTSVADMGPELGGQVESKGSERVRALGQFWVVGEGSGEMGGCGPESMILTLGYNPKTGHFVGTWVGSMMSHLWVYDGELDSERKVLTLNCQGPSMEDPAKLVSYQDIVELPNPDLRILRSRMQKEDGSWLEFMRAEYRRVGAATAGG